MITFMIVLFIAGYIMIALEHVVNINKATFALMMCGILWAAYAVCGNDPNLSEDMVTALGDTCEIVVFLIGAMTIVELIDRYGGFNIIVHRIHAKNKRGLMWVLAFVAFFLSSILDNMTTTIIMVMMLRRMLSDQKERWLFACVIVLAANSGGAWSPIGDITTIMLWMKNYVSSFDLIVNLIVPSLVSVVVPTLIATRYVKAEPVESGEAGQSVLGGGLGVALDEGQGVVDEGLGDAVLLGVDPLQRDFLLKIGHIGQVEQLGLADVLAALPGALKAHHLVGLAGHGGLGGGVHTGEDYN